MTAAEPLDIEQHDALLAYLRGSGLIAASETPVFRTLPGGVSSRTVLVARRNGPDWVLKQSLAKLRVAVDWFSDPARIHREALAIGWLPQFAPAGTIPALVFEDRERHLLGMEAVPQPHHNWKTMLLAGNIQMEHVRQFGDLLGAIHRGAAERRDEVAPIFGDRSIFESLRIEPYYAYTASRVPAAAGFLSRLIANVRRRRLTIVHGDYSPKNVLVYEGRLVLLDHEVIHFGDPAFDLGFSLAHLLSKAHHVEHLRPEFTSAAHIYWRTYRESLGDAAWAHDVEEHAAANTLGCLLARVAGRSPLEYLSDAQRARQQHIVLRLMDDAPASIAELVSDFSRAL